MGNITLEEAAIRAGLTTDQIKISRQRGLPPGSLGFVFEGKLTFNSDDFKAPSSIRQGLSMANSKAELLEAAAAAGMSLPAKITKAELLELLA